MLDGQHPPETEVTAKGRRRTFTAKYKRDIVAKIDACRKPGGIGEILRREGLYSSHLTTWRKEIKAQALAALAAKKRGPKPKLDERDRNIVEQQREIARLTARAERAELLVEIQKKVAALLGNPLPNSDEER